jgi:hypothetical protein
MKWTVDHQQICTITLDLPPNNEIGLEMVNRLNSFLKK